MKIKEFAPEKFNHLNEAAIDACSIIYLIKAGLLGSLGASLHLFTVKEVVDETGWKHLPVSIVESDHAISGNDKKLIAMAVTRNIPVISDDREVLEAANNKGLAYYNSLMMLNFLYYKNGIPENDYCEYKQRLVDAGHYSQFVIEYAIDVYKSIKKSRRGAEELK